MNADSRYFDEYYNYILDNDEPDSKAKKAVFGIIHNLTDRRGIKHEFNRIDADIQDEIVDRWVKIIDNAMGLSAPSKSKE